MAKTGYVLIIILAVIITGFVLLINLAALGNSFGSSLMNSVIIGFIAGLVGLIGWGIFDYVKPDNVKLSKPTYDDDKEYQEGVDMFEDTTYTGPDNYNVSSRNFGESNVFVEESDEIMTPDEEKYIDAQIDKGIDDAKKLL